MVLASIWNIAIGIIVSVYLLFDKDRFRALGRKVTYSIFHGPRANRTLELARRADTIFGRFLSGKILDSFIIGILTYIILMIFQMPFPIHADVEETTHYQKLSNLIPVPRLKS